MKIFRDLAPRARTMRDQDTKIRGLEQQLAEAKHLQAEYYRGRV